MDARIKKFKTPDGANIYYEWWIPANPKGNIVFIHGLGDHISRYGEFTRYFASCGFGVCMFDMRGHGQSSGRRAHCKSFSDLLRDLSQFIEILHESYETVPIFLVGHSFGAQVAINFVARYSKGIRGLVALSPNIEPLVKFPNWKRWLALKLSRWIPILKFKTGISPSSFSHDENVVMQSIADPLRSWHVTARMGVEILKNLEQIKRLAFQVKLPSLFMQGGSDNVTSIEATRKFYHSILVQNKDFKSYPGLYHELLHEANRQEIFQDIEGWLNNQLAAVKRLARAGEEEQYVGHETIDLWHHLNNVGHTGRE